MKKTVVFIFISACFFGLIAAKQGSFSSEVHEVDIVNPKQGEITDSILASGNLVFNTQVQLRSEVTGRVERVLVEEGQLVEKDDVLLELDNRAFQSEVNRLEAVVRSSEIAIKGAEINYNHENRRAKRQKQLYEFDLVELEVYEASIHASKLAAIELEVKKEELIQAKSSLLIARDNLSKSFFIAPISGLLASVDIKEGETVIAGTTNIVGSDLMLLADPSAIIAEIRLDESDIASINLGQETKIYAAAYPDTPFNGKVISIGTSAKRQQGSQTLSFKVKVLLEQTDKMLYAGMSCRAEISTEQSEPSLIVPIEAVQKDQDKHFVWVYQNDNTAEKHYVTVGISSNIEQSILEGLSIDDKVIIGPARPLKGLKIGDLVQVKQDTVMVGGS
jgi:HlyD family secretion protein